MHICVCVRRFSLIINLVKFQEKSECSESACGQQVYFPPSPQVWPRLGSILEVPMIKHAWYFQRRISLLVRFAVLFTPPRVRALFWRRGRNLGEELDIVCGPLSSRRLRSLLSFQVPRIQMKFKPHLIHFDSHSATCSVCLSWSDHEYDATCLCFPGYM